MKTFNYIIILQFAIICIALLTLTTCDREERNNPWDPKNTLNPDYWTPKNLTIENITISEKRISWSYDGDSKIEGFKIDRKVGNNNWEISHQVFDKSTKSWNDNNITPDSTITYSYRLYSFAGENKSSEVTITTKPIIPEPTNIQFEKINDIKYKLTWNDNSTGEQGFKIDRRTDGEEWLVAHATVESNQTAYVDNNVFITKAPILVEYRVYAYHGNYTSTKPTVSINAALTPPNDLSVSTNSSISVTLTWQYSQTTHQGFRVDRKEGDNDWQEAIASTGATQTSFTDNSVDFTTNIRYLYRVYAYYEQYNSEKIEVYIGKPELTTVSITNITATTASSGGNITKEGGASVTARGVVWSTSQSPTTTSNQGITSNGTGNGSYSSNLTNLAVNTTYYVRAYATNSVGTVYGNQQSFTTLDGVPMLTTTEITSISATTATSGGNITSDGGFAITTRGVVWSTSQNPTITSNQGMSSNEIGTGTFTSNITGLTQATTYFVRAYATNIAGTSYGEQLSFTTGITDIDGNIYAIVTIGSQVWMTENLRTTKYRNGSSIPNVTDSGVWGGLSTPAYCWNNNDIANKPTFGALYNWYAVNTGNLCPAGWHVPTDPEWYAMEKYVDPTINDPYATGWRGTNAGTKLKTISGWYNNGNGTDNYCFSALPGGYRSYGGDHFYYVGYYGYWWSSTETAITGASTRDLTYDSERAHRYSFNKRYGFSVRCVRD